MVLFPLDDKDALMTIRRWCPLWDWYYPLRLCSCTFLIYFQSIRKSSFWQISRQIVVGRWHWNERKRSFEAFWQGAIQLDFELVAQNSQVSGRLAPKLGELNVGPTIKPTREKLKNLSKITRRWRTTTVTAVTNSVGTSVKFQEL